MYFLVLKQQSSLLGLYGPVLLRLLGNTGKYSPSCQTNTENQLFQYCPTRKDNTGSITFRNWECLYYDSSWDIRWNIAWALGKSLVLRLYFTVYPSSRHNTDTISLTSHIVKVMERMLRKQIVGFLEMNEKMDPNQHGSRGRRSCLSQLLEHLLEV